MYNRFFTYIIIDKAKGACYMEHQKSNKRSIIIDTVLLTAIFSIFITIILITFIDGQNKQTVEKDTVDKHPNSVVYSIPKSETSETTSPYSHVRIVTDVSNDPYIPFAIQYPTTTHSNINEQIIKIVNSEKQQYIKEQQNSDSNHYISTNFHNFLAMFTN